MANLDRGKSLYYEWSRNDSSVEYHGLPELGAYQGVCPVSPAKSGSCHHVDNVSNEKNATAVIELTILPQTHLPPPPAYQSESCESQESLPRLEPLRSTHPSIPYTRSEHGEKSSEPQGFSFWRKKRGIILIVVLSNLIIIGMISGGILISRDVASHSTGSKDMTTTTEGYTSSTSVTSTTLPATIMSASPYQWGPSSDGTQASGNIIDSGNTESNSDAGGESKGFSGPHNKPGGGLH